MSLKTVLHILNIKSDFGYLVTDENSKFVTLVSS